MINRDHLTLFTIKGQLFSHLKSIVFLALFGLGIWAIWVYTSRPKINLAHGPLPQEIYVWQRQWTPNVQKAVANSRCHGMSFLACEITWEKGMPKAQHVEWNVSILQASKATLEPVLRIGNPQLLFRDHLDATTFVMTQAAKIVLSCQSLKWRTLQIDFDCPTAKLQDYAYLLQALKQVFPHLSITALPTWLREPTFLTVLEETEDYVLQVHSFDRSKEWADRKICDSVETITWVERANALKRPFRVALPTYSYSVIQNERGDELQLLAEGPKPNLEVFSFFRLTSDPVAMANLMATWKIARPEYLRSVIWFRLPVEGDVNNWSEATFAAVREGRVPRTSHRYYVQEDQGVLNLSLENTGETNLDLPQSIPMQWDSGTILARDGLWDYHFSALDTTHAAWVRKPHLSDTPLSPGESRSIAWLKMQDVVNLKVGGDK